MPEIAPNRGSILVVDDNPANLRLLEEMLREHKFEVRSFPRGRLALASAAKEPPDLILLDINMPEMNGYEVCEQLKANAILRSIPVIFLSALNETEDKVKGLNVGAVDYISKPFRFEEVRARVETHVQLRRAQQAQADLLEKTLGGAVDTLWELVQLTSPVLAARSRAIRSIVQWTSRELGITDAWKYELGATLCLVGCITLPDEVFEKGYCGQQLLPEERRMFEAHPARAAQLLSKIPRLEPVAEIIRRQHEVLPADAQRSELGMQLLPMALEFDRRVYRGLSATAALTELKRLCRFAAPALNALESYAPPETEFDIRRIPIRELRIGMILEGDVTSKDGRFPILKQGTVLTETWLERLENFSKSCGVQAVVDVRLPRLAGLEK